MPYVVAHELRTYVLVCCLDGVAWSENDNGHPTDDITPASAHLKVGLSGRVVVAHDLHAVVQVRVPVPAAGLGHEHALFSWLRRCKSV